MSKRNMIVRVLHALQHGYRETNLEFNASFGVFKDAVDRRIDVEYVNPLFFGAEKTGTVDLTVVTYDLLSLRSARYDWIQVEERIVQFCAKSTAVIFFPQDDYTATGLLEDLFERVSPSAVYTSGESGVELMYARSIDRFRFEKTLTGYFWNRNPHSHDAESFMRRKYDFGGRTNVLPAYFGKLANNKTHFAKLIAESLAFRGFKVNFSDKAEDVLVGEAWRNFMLSIRSTPISLGGASRRDYWGFEAFWYQSITQLGIPKKVAYLLSKRFGVREFPYLALGPRFFDAIDNGCALIMPPGRYFEGFEAGIHYIAVNRDDLTNGTLAKKLLRKDDLFRYTERARQFVEQSPQMHYRGFVKELLRRELPVSQFSQKTEKKRFPSEAPTDAMIELSKTTSSLYSALLKLIAFWLTRIRSGQVSSRAAVSEIMDSLEKLHSPQAFDIEVLRAGVEDFMERSVDGSILPIALFAPMILVEPVQLISESKS